MPRKTATAAPAEGDDDDRDAVYQSHRERMAEASRERSKAGREIGPLPKVKNPRRKARCAKSLKLFLFSFRNHAAFHEDCTVGIGRRLVGTLEPRWLRIGGYWYPRGGIPIDVFWQTGDAPEGLWVPDQGVSPYRGRG